MESLLQLLSPGKQRSFIPFSTEEFSAKQEQVAQVAARIQHLIVELGVIQSQAADSETECSQMCVLLTALLQKVSSSLDEAGLKHLAETAIVSPRLG